MKAEVYYTEMIDFKRLYSGVPEKTEFVPKLFSKIHLRPESPRFAVSESVGAAMGVVMPQLKFSRRRARWGTPEAVTLVDSGSVGGGVAAGFPFTS